MIPFKIAASAGHGRGAALGLLLGAALWFAAPALYRWRSLEPVQKSASLRLALLLTVAAAAGNVAQGLALARLHAGVASVILQTQLLWVALLGWIWLRERVRPMLGIGLVLCLAGLSVMRGTDLYGLRLEGGVLWALLAALGFAMMDITSRKHAARADSLVANALRALLAACLVALVPGSIGELMEMTPVQLGALALAALLGPGAARQLLIMAARDLPASESSLLQQLRPLIALPLASLWFGVWPRPQEWTGCVLILIGLGLPLLSPPRS